MNKTLARKVGYCLAIALLIYPLYLIGSPSTATKPGGKLAQLRSQYNLFNGGPRGNRSRQRIDEAGHTGASRSRGEPALAKGAGIQEGP